jgi:mxaJ protein
MRPRIPGPLATVAPVALARVAVTLVAVALVGVGLAAVALAGSPSSRPPAGGGDRSASPALRVCADPDNLPFSNARGEGFENRIAERLADDLGRRLEYTWWAQRRGFLRHTLRAGACDVVIGVPARMEGAWATRPYYRSSYVFVERRDRRPAIRSFDDRRLVTRRIAVPLVSDDGANAPPAHALARRGLSANLVRFSVLGDGAGLPPGARLIDAVARGQVDVGAAWGPVAGYFAARQPVPLRITPVAPAADGALRQAFDIAMATRRDDTGTHAALEAYLDRRRAEIDRVLAAFDVPRVDRPGPSREAGR